MAYACLASLRLSLTCCSWDFSFCCLVKAKYTANLFLTLLRRASGGRSAKLREPAAAAHSPVAVFPSLSTCRPADVAPLMNISAASRSHLPVSSITQDLQAGYMPSPSQSLIGLVNNNPTSSCNSAAQPSAAKSTNMASLFRSSSLGNMPWPIEGGSQHLGNPDAILFSNNSLSLNTIGLHNPPTTYGNSIEANSKAAQQSMLTQLGLDQNRPHCCGGGLHMNGLTSYIKVRESQQAQGRV